MTNPLLTQWDTPFKLPPFSAIEDGHFEPAFDAALAESRAAIDAIAENPEAPSFANTIEALELADEALDRVLGVFYNLAGADSTPAREELQRKFSPRLASYSAEVSMNAALFQRVEAVWAARDSLDLTEEQARVLMLTRRSFVRSGAQLEGADRDRLKAVGERLAALGTQFTQNLLADERSWFMPLAESDLEGLPDFVTDAARAAGAE